LLLEEYEVTFEYIPGKKIFFVAGDVLSRIDIDSLEIQEKSKEELTILSGSENKSISNIKSTIPIQNASIFKEQAKVKNTGLREKNLTQPHYSIQNIE
jgi:hypothetical protein